MSEEEYPPEKKCEKCQDVMVLVKYGWHPVRKRYTCIGCGEYEQVEGDDVK